MELNKPVFIGGVVLLVAAGTLGAFLNCGYDDNFQYEYDGVGTYIYHTEDRLRFCWNFLFQPRIPKGPDKSVEVPIMGPKSMFLVSEFQLGREYNSNPPTSGWNVNIGLQAPAWRVYLHKTYAELIQSEIAVARLYNGFVWITYKIGSDPQGSIKVEQLDKYESALNYVRGLSQNTDRASQEVIEQLKKIAASTPGVFVSGRARIKNADIVISALGRQDRFYLEDGKLTPELEGRIWDFILRYRYGAARVYNDQFK